MGRHLLPARPRHSESVARITNVAAQDYVTEDGTRVSETTFYENGVFSSVVKEVKANGAYTVTVRQGELLEVHRGVYANYSNQILPQIHNGIENAPTRTVMWEYEYWGTDYYSVSVTALQTCATVASLAGTLAECMRVYTAQLVMNVAEAVFTGMVNYYSQYGCNTVYFKAQLFYGVEPTTSRAIYHHIARTTVYANSARTTQIAYGANQYDSLYFSFG